MKLFEGLKFKTKLSENEENLLGYAENFESDANKERADSTE